MLIVPHKSGFPNGELLLLHFLVFTAPESSYMSCSRARPPQLDWHVPAPRCAFIYLLYEVPIPPNGAHSFIFNYKVIVQKIALCILHSGAVHGWKSFGIRDLWGLELCVCLNATLGDEEGKKRGTGEGAQENSNVCKDLGIEREERSRRKQSCVSVGAQGKHRKVFIRLGN